MPAIPGPGATSYENHYADFIQRFVRDESAKKKRSKPLTAEQSAAHSKQLGGFASLIQHTLTRRKSINIAGILRKWKA
jgi:hypothetical protein